MVETSECMTGRGINQIGTLHRAGATRWSSHFDSICSLIDMYEATMTVLNNIIDEASCRVACWEAKGASRAMKSFDFVFKLHLMDRMMSITDILCRAVQAKDLDVLNAIDLVSSTKSLLQNFREDGSIDFLMKVKSICKKVGIAIPVMDASYRDLTGRSCRQKDHITYEHHYRVNIFNVVIDSEIMELSNRFSDASMELLVLISALESRHGFQSFRIDDTCILAEKFYPDDFTSQEMHYLRSQLEHYEHDVARHQWFQVMSTISELCRRLIETSKGQNYYLVDRLVCLVLALPISTASTERAFSAMKHIKTNLRSKIEVEFLADAVVINIEKDFAENIDSDEIIDEFYSIKNSSAQLK